MEPRRTFTDFQEIEDTLRRQKTMFREPMEEESLFRLLCPSMLDEDALRNYEIKLKLLQKLMRNISGKIKNNQYLIVFDEPRSRISGGSHLLLDGDLIEVLLPIRTPVASNMIQISPEYFHVKVQGREQSQKTSIEMSEALCDEYGSETICSPSKVCKVIYTILRDGLQLWAPQMKEYVNIISLSMDNEEEVIIVDSEFNKDYLTANVKQKHRKSMDTLDDSLSECSSVEIVPAPKIKDIDITEGPVEVVYDVKVKFRIIPSITINVKEKSYLTGLRPIHHAASATLDKAMSHAWFQDCWWKEQLIIDKICSADKFTRLCTAAGTLQFCRLDPDLEWITPMHIKHNLLLQVDNSLDNIFLSWQRRSLHECFIDQLESLRDQLHDGRIVNYFNHDNNLVDQLCIQNGLHKKALIKLTMLLKSRASLIRSLNEAIAKLYSDHTDYYCQ